MGQLGIGLGVLVALLWASADIIASLSARRWNTFKTTFASQSAGLCALCICGGIVLLWHHTFTPMTLIISAFIGIITGGCAAVGYFAFYRALEIGPVALVSPLSATSSTVTLLLATVFLQEHLSRSRVEIVILIICGVVLASTNVKELRLLFHQADKSFWSPGVRWAMVATLCFGVMDFGIGASASVSNWLLPVIWTRLFSILFLVFISRVSNRKKKFIFLPLSSSYQVSYSSTSGFSLPSRKECAHIRHPFSSTTGLGLLLALVAGLVENAAVLTFSIDSRIITTGITSVLASSYAVVVLLFGLFVYRERLVVNQWVGIALFLFGLTLLSW